METKILFFRVGMAQMVRAHAPCAAHGIPGSSPSNVCKSKWISSTAILAIKRSASVTSEVNVRNPLHTGEEAYIEMRTNFTKSPKLWNSRKKTDVLPN